MKNAFHEIFFRNFFKLATVVVLVSAFLYILSPFLVPFIFGGMLAMALSPFLSYFMSKKKWSKKRSLLVLTLILFFVGGVPVTVFFLRGAKIITQFFSQQSFSVLTSNVQDRIYAFLDHFSELNNFNSLMVREKFNNFINQAASWVLKTMSDLLTQVPDYFLAVLVMILSFYFFLLKEDEIRKVFNRYFYLNKRKSDRFVEVMKSSCREVFFSNVLTGVLQSSIVSIGALACGIGDFYIIFVFTFILSFIPVIGASPMAFALGIFAFFDGRVGSGIVMSIIGTISGISDNILRPYLVSLGEVEVPAFIGFLAVVGGVIVMGLPGLFVGPLVASMIYGILPIMIEEYFPIDHPDDVQDSNEDIGQGQ